MRFTLRDVWVLVTGICIGFTAWGWLAVWLSDNDNDWRSCGAAFALIFAVMWLGGAYRDLWIKLRKKKRRPRKITAAP